LIPDNGSYLLSFQWIPPVNAEIGRFMEIYINDVIIDNLTINSSNSVTNYAYNYSKIVYVKSNTVLLAFQMGGTTAGYGIMLDNIGFQQAFIDYSNYT
jgi:hypothetical protein